MSNNYLKLNLAGLNKSLAKYTWKGYDLYFLHGWFTAYLLSSGNSEEDLLIPGYLILDEAKLDDDKQFSGIVDDLVLVYNELAQSIYDKNKQIRPMINYDKPNVFDVNNITEFERHNLLKWLYGYLSAYVITGEDVPAHINDQNLLDGKFYPALFTLCIALFSLDGHVALSDYLSDKFKADYAELKLDLKSMWESDENEPHIEDLFSSMQKKLD